MRRRIRWPLAAGIVAVVGAAGGVGAIASQFTNAAAVGSPAERIWPVNSNGMLFPIEPTPKCEFLNNFGEARSTHTHQGVDIGAQGPDPASGYPGQAVYAVEDATVYAAKFVDTGNDGISLRLSSTGRDMQYRYFHLASIAAGINVGSVVRKGQVIGHVGDTGNATPGGWHLHFEVRPGPSYEPVDPAPLLAIPSVCRMYGTVTPVTTTTTTVATTSTTMPTTTTTLAAAPG